MVARTANPEQVTISAEEYARLRGREKELEADNLRLELQLRILKQELWGRRSERSKPTAAGEAPQAQLFSDPMPATPPAVAPKAPRKTSDRPAAARPPRGPRPLDPSLPRVVVQVPSPDLKDLMCPVTKRPMQPTFKESIEVLARRAPEFYVKVFERWVHTSPAKTAPVSSPWPTNVLPRSRVDASIVGFVAAAHYALHLPFARIEEDLARKGVHLPRSSQVSLMAQFDEMLRPMGNAIRDDVLGHDLLQLDGTVVKVRDPQRPGALRDACIWAYRNGRGVWFEYQPTKEIKSPDAVLRKANFKGNLQTDGAQGLDALGPPGQVVHHGCLAHCRRPFFKALTVPRVPEARAQHYLDGINRIFRIDRLAKHFGLSEKNHQHLREKYSVVIFDALVARARDESGTLPPSLLTGEGITYLINQHEPLRRTILNARMDLSNNECEAALRPLKLGANNWICVGHPGAGDRLANLFTIAQNCRRANVDPEAYFIDLLGRLGDHPAARINELLPRNWKPASTTAAAS